ncbi:hypothetical protein [Humibacillus xanthopallidus]|uniref:hypothetical protein n=1 Tax=Humibacillus xanthopallidus TaxID=412689 RepID=UPI003850D57A
MRPADVSLRLTPQETLARDLIHERAAVRHRALRRRHPSRAALLLRSLADRLDQSGHSELSEHPGRVDCAHAAGARVVQPRPWSATVRRAPHRHS